MKISKIQVITAVFIFIIIGTAIGISFLRNPSVKKTICPRCNIVIIDIDTWRADSLPCYGYQRNTAPNICDFASKGVLFKKNFSQSHLTLASMFSTLTSLYPINHGVLQEFRDELPINTKTLTEYLKEQGYKTYWTGPIARSNIFPDNGGTRGWDEIDSKRVNEKNWGEAIHELKSKEQPFFAYFYSGSLHAPYLLEKGKNPIVPLLKPPGFPLTDEEFEEALGKYLIENYDKVFSAEAIRQFPDIFFSDKKERQKLLFQLFSSINPSTDPQGETRLLLDKWGTIYNTYTKNLYEAIEKGNGSDAIKFIKSVYDTKIFDADAELQDLLKTLSGSDLSENTVVIIMSDHGEEFMEHGKFAHDFGLYNELLHVPLILYIPGISSTTITDVTENIDIMPTILEIVGVDFNEQRDGESLVPLLKPNFRNSRKDNYAVSMLEKGDSFTMVAIQDDKWKLIVNFDSVGPDYQLFDLELDPLEQNNVSDQNRSEVTRLYSILNQKFKNKNFERIIPKKTFPAWIEEKKRKELMERGYF